MKNSKWYAQTQDGTLYELKTQKSFTTASREAVRRFGETVKTVRFPVPDDSDGEIKTAAAVMGRKGGKVKSEAKTKAARENGQKGGRPRKMNIREKLNMEWRERRGKAPSWDAVVNLMDDEIRERVHNDLAPCTEAEFFAAYDELDGGKLGDITQW